MATNAEIKRFLKLVVAEQNKRLNTTLGSTFNYKGSVDSFSALPTTGNKVGDIYNVQTAGGTDIHGTAVKAGDNVAYTNDGWDVLAGTTDLTPITNKLDNIEAGAQVNVIESVKVDNEALTVTNKTVNIDLSGKVDVVTGKQLSTNDYTTAEKNKLGDIAANAQVNVIETIKVDSEALSVTNKTVNIDLSGKVDKDGSKVLSTNDYTTAEKNKLADIAAGAQVNVIESIKVDNTALTINNKAVNIDLSNKVDKVTGKGLSANDFTDVYKKKVDDADTALNATFSAQDLEDIFAD